MEYLLFTDYDLSDIKYNSQARLLTMIKTRFV